MTNTDEAAAILVRTFEALARANGKTLSARTRQDIARACDLLASSGAELDTLLDDLPRVSPAERMAADAEKDPAYIEWRAQRRDGRER
jgi:hypothetical protein